MFHIHFEIKNIILKKKYLYILYNSFQNEYETSKVKIKNNNSLNIK